MQFKTLSEISIRDKLRVIIMLTSGIVLLLASLAFIANDVFQMRKSMVEELFVLADLVGVNSRPGLQFKDPDAVHHNLSVLTVSKHIILTHVFDDKGILFASYFRGGAEQTLDSRPAKLELENNTKAVQSYLFQPDYIEIINHIIYEDRRIGTIYIRADLGEFNQRLLEAALIVAGILMISLLLAYMLASRFQRVITVPIFSLLETMNLVPAAKDYSIRAEKLTEDELGNLVDGFNQMLAQIQRRDQELTDYRLHLEDQVKSRTAELALSRDEAVAANVELQRQSEELATARDMAEAANRAKSIFLANMSHELRTPLNGILGYAQILNRDRALNEKQRNGIEVIQRSGNYLLTLINDILDLSKIEAGQIELYPTVFSFAKFIQSIVELNELRARQKGIQFICEAPPNPPFDSNSRTSLPIALWADEKRLRQILINLIGNAVKFTQRGEVRLQIGYVGEKIRFCVQDSGVGIAAEELENIFQPFKQVGDVMHKAEGTGLGLSITKKLVEMMDGRIQVSSLVGQGSIFSFDLRLQEAESSQAEKPPTLTAIGYARPADGRRYRILVVDDKLENRLVIINLLEPLGFEVSEAEDGLDAVEKVIANPPDTILMDLIMPRLNGLDAIARIRQMPEFDRIPILVASASAFDVDRKRSLEVGATDFIAKPVQEEMLLACLQKYLGLQWEYEAPAEEIAAAGTAAGSTDEAGLTPQQAGELYDLAMRGNISGIMKFLEQIEQDNPAQRGIAKRIRQLAKEFKEEEICELAEQYKQVDG